MMLVNQDGFWIPVFLVVPPLPPGFTGPCALLDAHTCRQTAGSALGRNGVPQFLLELEQWHDH